MHSNPRYSFTPFSDTSKGRLWIVIGLRAFSLLLGIATGLGVLIGGLYLTPVYEDYFYRDLLIPLVWTILYLLFNAIICLFYYATEVIIHAWANRYYARIESLEHNKKNQEHKARPAREKATLTMLYLAGFLFPPNERLAALGDMEEQFNLTKDKFGALRANGYLAYDICRTFLVKTAPFIKRLIKILSLTSLGSVLIWLVNQLEFVRELYEYVFHR